MAERTYSYAEVACVYRNHAMLLERCLTDGKSLDGLIDTWRDIADALDNPCDVDDVCTRVAYKRQDKTGRWICDEHYNALISEDLGLTTQEERV